MYIRTLDGNLLRFENNIDAAEHWINENGYSIKWIGYNDIFVVDSDIWFIK